MGGEHLRIKQGEMFAYNNKTATNDLSSANSFSLCTKCHIKCTKVTSLTPSLPLNHTHDQEWELTKREWKFLSHICPQYEINQLLPQTRPTSSLTTSLLAAAVTCPHAELLGCSLPEGMVTPLSTEEVCMGMSKSRFLNRFTTRK